jgi:hypothetical protein
VRTPKPNCLKLPLLVWGILLLALAPCVYAQDDPGDVPLGDVARSFRKNTASPETLINIDNDNLSKVVDDAEGRRTVGSAMVFSLDPGGNSFHVSSPDVTCSLSFSGKSTSLLSDPLVLDELPRSELAKLDGPATIDGDSLQVSMHNGTSWELREVVIGLTIIKRPEPGETAPYFGQPQIVPAVAGISPQIQDSLEKRPDVTVLLRVKGSAAPSTTAIFRTPLNFALFPDQEWHWAIVKAKGVPPQTSPEPMLQPAQSTGQNPPGPAEAGTPTLLVPPGQGQSSAGPASSNPDASIH